MIAIMYKTDDFHLCKFLCKSYEIQVQIFSLIRSLSSGESFYFVLIFTERINSLRDLVMNIVQPEI